MKREKLIAVGLSAVILSLAGCGHETRRIASETQPVASVRVQKIGNKPRVATEDVVGTVRAKLHSVIEAKVSGKIEKLLVVPGQTVTNGELLAQLDAREIQSQLEQALAVQKQAESDLNRIEPLARQNILSQSELDAAQAKYRIAEAAVTQAATLVSYAKVAAPFDGIITRKYADVGDLATPGKALLEMENPNALRLEADVPEAAIGRLSLGDKLPARISSISNTLESVVSEISPAADPNSRTFLVKCDLPSSPNLRTGQFGRVAIPIGETSALRVPTSAVIQRGQMELVFVVANGHAQLRIVKTGKHVGDEVELVSGVDAGEQVVIGGANDLMDGQPVEAK